MSTTTEPISAALPPGKWYAISNKAEENEAEILIYDVIGAYGVNAEQFIKDLAALEAKTLNIRINTEGGEVFDATAIYNAIKNYPGRVVTQVDGVAASAGSFIALAGDEVRMADNSYMMIHEARSGVMGEAADMRTMAETLDKINETLSGMYQKKAGKTRKYWRDKMADETWFTADEAMAEGLADEVFEAEKKQQSARAHAAFDFTIYNQAKIPPAVKAMWGISNSTIQPAPKPSPSGEPSQALTQEIQPMAETLTQAASAQTPAAVTTSNVQQGDPAKPIDAAEAHAKKVAELQGLQAEAQFRQGYTKGNTEGRAEAVQRMKDIVAACPGKPQMAIDAFIGGQTPQAVAMAFGEAAKIEAAAKVREDELKLETERWRTLAATGGYPGGVGVQMAGEPDADEPEIDPKTRAEAEWDRNYNNVRSSKSFSSKANYVAFRKRELAGTVTVK